MLTRDKNEIVRRAGKSIIQLLLREHQVTAAVFSCVVVSSRQRYRLLFICLLLRRDVQVMANRRGWFCWSMLPARTRSGRSNGTRRSVSRRSSLTQSPTSGATGWRSGKPRHTPTYPTRWHKNVSSCHQLIYANVIGRNCVTWYVTKQTLVLTWPRPTG